MVVVPGCPSNQFADWPLLASGIARRDADAMTSLYARLQGFRALFVKQVGSQEADDHLSDVFLAVVHAILAGRVNDPCRLPGFVMSVARFRTASRIAALAAERHRTVHLDSLPFLRSDIGQPDDRAWRRQRREIAAEVLGRLRPNDREILIRFYLQEQPEETICREMRLTRTQFRLLKWRAKARLQQAGLGRILKNTGHKSGAGAHPRAGAEVIVTGRA